jgi:hypothetical protein
MCKPIFGFLYIMFIGKKEDGKALLTRGWLMGRLITKRKEKPLARLLYPELPRFFGWPGVFLHLTCPKTFPNPFTLSSLTTLTLEHNWSDYPVVAIDFQSNRTYSVRPFANALVRDYF